MKGQSDVIEHLNRVLANQLIAINQYFLHSRMQRNQGFGQLSSAAYRVSIAEMKYADRLTERILLLEGLPNLQYLGKLLIGEDVPEMLHCDQQLQHLQLDTLREAIAVCEQQEDFVSRDMLSSMLGKEEEQLDWLETQLGLVDSMGLSNYLQSIV
jgi:bacterioferritin